MKIPSPSSSQPSRRKFTKLSAAAAATTFGFQFVPSRVFGANDRPALAGIGSGGKGKTDIEQSAKSGFDVIALVDIVDVKRIQEADPGAKKLRSRLGSMRATRESHPDAKFYSDYRDMLSDLGDKVDAVTISTPDHHHFHAAMMAMKAGKHVYCQKPLTHGIWEARMLTEVAEKMGVQTQMGNQAHANDHMRRVVELVRAGIIGKVKEVHAWTNRPIWPQGFETPPVAERVPSGIDWEQWIGPAPYVDYSSKIAPFAWRGWWNFGTGALGDMACHIMDMAYWALDLGAPTSVEAVEEGMSRFSAPINSTVTYDFGKKGVKYFWYDGQRGAKFDRDNWRLIPGDFNRPGDDILEGMDYKKYGSVLIGEKGKLFFNRFQDSWIVKPSKALDGFNNWPEPSIPRARDQNNYHEWLDAIHGKVEHGQSYFGQSGPFTEVVLLGCLAQRNPGQKLEWNAEKMEVKGRPELSSMIRRKYRPGWEIEV